MREPLEFSVEFMHPSSIELMCETFLRSALAPKDIRLEYTLLRIGKTMPAIDIYGRSVKGNKIFAQVTYAHSNQKKVTTLIQFAQERGKTILFSRDKKTKINGLDYHFNIADIFELFANSSESKWQAMLRELIGFTTVRTKSI